MKPIPCPGARSTNRGRAIETTKDPEDIVMRWISAYQKGIKDNATAEQALFLADTTLPQVSRNGGANGKG